MLEQTYAALSSRKKQYPAFQREFGKRHGIPIGVELECGSPLQNWRSPNGLSYNAYLDSWVHNYCDARHFMFLAGEDGSVSYPGMELKFWPASVLHWYKMTPKLTSLFQALKNDNLASSLEVGAGMHIHISTKNTRWQTLYAILFATAHHKEWWQRISGRSEYSFNRWCAFPNLGGMLYQMQSNLLYNTGLLCNGINSHSTLSNIELGARSTLELRAFTGTLDVTTFLARIEFMHLLHAIAEAASKSWTKMENTSASWFNPSMLRAAINTTRTPNLARVITIPNQPLYNLGLGEG